MHERRGTEQGSIALSGFAQTFGYTGGALGPLGVAFLHDVTGTWDAPLIALGIVVAIAVAVAATETRRYAAKRAEVRDKRD